MTATNQKTLGMAWGANSRSASRSAFRHSPFSDFGSYMALKNRKLQEQFDAEASSSSNVGPPSTKPIFQGVSIFVDGYTVPSSQELRRYMLKYGGRFVNYFSRHQVTHIICSNLPDSKIKNLRSFSGGLPIVKPTWVLDCVAANDLLSWIPYQLDQLSSETDNQPKLSVFFSTKVGPASDDITSARVESQSLREDGAIVDANFHEEGETSESSKGDGTVSDDLSCKVATVRIHEEPNDIARKHCEGEMDKPNDASLEGGKHAELEEHPSSCRASARASVYSGMLDDHSTKELSSSKVGSRSSQEHSTLTDPNFVENYFKYSRLHFIGTWRNRYLKRFSSGSSRTSSRVNASAMSPRSIIIHVDMDCFFVSVVIRKRPELRDKPVAICHSDNAHGTAEISSANYPARDHGIKAGMFVRDAKALCPHLRIFPYDFEAYEEVADQFYNILHKHCNRVKAVSCDEAFLDVTDLEVGDLQNFVSRIRNEILVTTGCTASAGISGNMLMSRLATRTAKPDGQCYIPPEKVEDYLRELPVKALPGIGNVLEEKLRMRQVKTCGQLQLILKESLRKDFGNKTGDMLWNYSRGIDNRLVGAIQVTKSVGAEVNWGVRFNDMSEMQHFLRNLCKEVALRLQGCEVRGRKFTLKIKKKRIDAGEPIKYMGCGECDNLSHSMTVPMATDDVDVLCRIAAQLFGYFNIDCKDIRGMGMQVSKLEVAKNEKPVRERNSIHSWLISASGRSTELSNQAECSHAEGHQSVRSDFNQLTICPSGAPGIRSIGISSGRTSISHDSALPPLHDLDLGVIESLPPEVFSEINKMYNGKLLSFIMENRENKADSSTSFSTRSENLGMMVEMNRSFPVHPEEASDGSAICEETRQKGKNVQDVSLPGEGISDLATSGSVPEGINLMPSSLSQVDASVLQQLPEDLRKDILEYFPAHRESDASLGKNELESNYTVSRMELWIGNPPPWVDKFKISSCLVLNILSEIFLRSGRSNELSSILQRTVYDVRLRLDVGTIGLGDAISDLSELFKQYVELKIETDIEEIYLCASILRRISGKSKLFLEVYNNILPHIQAAVEKNYGGRFNLCCPGD